MIAPSSPELRPASPWDALLGTGFHPQVARHQKAKAEQPAAARANSKLAALLEDLAQRTSSSTRALADRSGLTVRQVWGLFKTPRSAGQVRFEDGRWSIVDDFAGRDVERAAALLRSKGWRVDPPGPSVPGSPDRRQHCADAD